MDTNAIDMEKRTTSGNVPESSSRDGETPDPHATELNGIEAETAMNTEYPQTARLAAIVASLMLGMFLVALDNASCSFLSVAYKS
jgi:hypothetical protein